MRRAALALLPVILLLSCEHSLGQGKVAVHVSANVKLGAWQPIWRYFGYDEPNYTYMNYGKRLLAELSALTPEPVYIRTHNLLTTGNGAPALKWGSTNAYTEDANGRPVYDWTVTDRIFDAYRNAGLKPFVEIGFMPKAMSTHPLPYEHEWPKGSLWTGWSYPPKDYQKWAELVYQWVRHSIERYGRREVESWYWEVWNEPDIPYWQGSADEYSKLYDFSAAAVKRALPTARVGGPATTGPASTRAGEFLRQFLEHCSSGRNFATGAIGSPLDFITYHAKGQASVVDGRVRMNLEKQSADVQTGLEIVSAYPKFRTLPVILTESDPEGCAACSARQHPENAYRNGPLYAAYTAAMLGKIVALSERYGNRIEGMLTWAFEFEGQPYFEGFRTLSTNGIDKPVLNFFRMAGLMRGDRVKVSGGRMSSSNSDVASEVNALAALSEREISVLAWNYDNDDVSGPATQVRLQVHGLPPTATHVLLTHYRIDRTHSNAYTLWQQLGSPRDPRPEQYDALVAAGQLQNADSPSWIGVQNGTVELSFDLPREAVSLLRFSW